MKKLFFLNLIGAALLFLFTGCRNAGPKYTEFPPAAVSSANTTQMVTLTNQINPAWLTAPTNLFTLGPGDKVEIQLIDDPSSKELTVVGPDGKIYFNLLPGIDVWGKTLAQAKAEMERELTKYIRGTPRVNITLRQVASKRVWILGRVQVPGIYPMQSRMRLLEAIAMAGGSATFTGTKDVSGGPLGEDLSDLKHSFIVRDGKLLPVDFDALLNKGDLSQNIYLQPDDFIYFAPAFSREVYVLGAVVQPKPVPYADGMTVAAAVAGAFGTVRDAYLYHVVVIRGSLSKPQIAVVDLKKIMHGAAHDMTLQPNDIVYVPFSPYRYLRKYLDIALNTFVSSVALNAGAHLSAQGNTVGTGVFIPVGSGVQVIPPPAPPIQ
ncbi:MAG TPA: polysaccharide biosynthesis/export family protein [Verrucomicrobiae bacterium]|nr:polysaccharide biosynthesis/export family protein [Verrucomicrobiae bacterium]